MKTILTNYRYYLLIVLLTIAGIGILAIPVDDLPASIWLYILISSKIIGFTSVYVAAKLVKRWDRKCVIPELSRIINSIYNP